jgi:hypothetical protein
MRLFVNGVEEALDKMAAIGGGVRGKSATFNDNLDFIDRVAGEAEGKEAFLNLEKGIKVILVGAHDGWLISKIALRLVRLSGTVEAMMRATGTFSKNSDRDDA